MLNYKQFLLEYTTYTAELVHVDNNQTVYQFNNIIVIFSLITTLPHNITLYECSFGTKSEKIVELFSKSFDSKDEFQIDDDIVLNDGNLFSTMNTIIEIIKKFLQKENVIIRIIGKANQDDKNVRHILYKRYLSKYKNDLVDYHLGKAIYLSSCIIPPDVKKLLI
jgi:hypothetical protein